MIAGETVNFAMRYPEGHDLAGKLIEREAVCSRCQRKFTQQRIDRDYLNSFHKHSPDRLEAFLRTCHVEGKEVWLPARCWKCDRAQMNSRTEESYAPIL
jgi:hypothetical protein